MQMPFISPAEPIAFPHLWRDFSGTEGQHATLTITGLGLYRATLNGQRIGGDYLTPGFNDYDAYVTCQTYDVSSLLQAENRLDVWLGDGWYKGRFGLNGGEENTWGSEYRLAVNLTVDGQVVLTTDEQWLSAPSSILSGNIYDGEKRDDTLIYEASFPCKLVTTDLVVEPEIVPPVRVVDERTATLILSPTGETILDFGQNMSGIVRFQNRLAYGKTITLRYFEVLQQGCYFGDNLRSAKQTYEYISDGNEKEVEPWFTFFGFRYVLVEGLEAVNPQDFVALALSCDLRQTLRCETSLPKVNRLMQNSVWGQRSNFLYVPTDCPQRDERLGWTADTQVFTKTACYHMDCRDFYEKFVKDMRIDQKRYYNGDVPMFTPSLKGRAGPGGAVWADAATIIPWTVYQFYGDGERLQKAYPLMRDYVETLIAADHRLGDAHMVFDAWTFGDWLALDGSTPTSVKGGTDDAFIQGVYYYHSVRLAGQAARVLGLSADTARYEQLADAIHAALLDEYITPNGNLSVNTQTGYVLSLTFGIYRDKDKIIAAFAKRLQKDLYTLRTGFTGTPLLLPALFDNGMEEIAYRLLLKEDFPSWLYAVNLGATTIWERWNSLDAQGNITGIGMNSLNHYAYGAVCEAIYSRMAGLTPATPGWKTARIAPQPNWRMKNLSLAFDSPVGAYKVSWRIEADGRLTVEASIPVGAQACIVLPDHPEQRVIDAAEGTHAFTYQPTKDYLHPFSVHSLLCDLLASKEVTEVLKTQAPALYAHVMGENRDAHALPLLSIVNRFGPVREEDVMQLEPALRAIRA